MEIRKFYKFYYGHRNQKLTGSKCIQPHGHLAQFYCYFNVIRKGGISTLFENFDLKIEPFLKNEFDHRFILDINDPLAETFRLHTERTGENLGPKIIPFPSSVENVSFYLFHRITKMGFNLIKLEFQETTTSTLVYTQADYSNDINSELGKILISIES